MNIEIQYTYESFQILHTDYSLSLLSSSKHDSCSHANIANHITSLQNFESVRFPRPTAAFLSSLHE